MNSATAQGWDDIIVMGIIVGAIGLYWLLVRNRKEPENGFQATVNAVELTIVGAAVIVVLVIVLFDGL